MCKLKSISKKVIRKLVKYYNMFYKRCETISKYYMLFICYSYKKVSRSFFFKLLDKSNLRYTGKYQEVKSSNKLIILCLNKEALPPKKKQVKGLLFIKG